MKKSLSFKPLKKTRLYEEVAEQIKQAIYKDEFSPGERLPSERELCQIFNVGRPTIREALRTLSIMGLVDVKHGSGGSRVKEADITQYLEALREQLSWLLKTDKMTLLELWEVRKYIELGIAHAVAVNATEEDFEKLEELIKKMEACGDDVETYFPIGIEFHHELALASKNKIYLIIWDMFYDILLKGYFPILRELFPEGPSNIRQANKDALAAIKTGDRDAIDKAMEAHAGEENLLSQLREDERCG